MGSLLVQTSARAAFKLVGKESIFTSKVKDGSKVKKIKLLQK